MSFLIAMALTARNCSNMSSVELAPNNVSIESDEGVGGLSLGPVEGRDGPPWVTKVVGELKNLSNVMQTFHYRWDDLQKHLDFIDLSIDRREKPLVSLLPSPSHQPKNSVPNVTANDSETVSLTAKEKTGLDMSEPQNQESELMAPIPLSPGNSSKSEVESICRGMCGRALRKYIVTHLSEASKLRREVPAALKRAPDAGKLVLECVGKFFLQGRRAFSKGSAMLSSRQAAFLILEYFLLMNCHNGIEQSVKEEAEQAAVAWRKRLRSEGGVFNASDQDARGLLLLLACFGIPDVFAVEDLMHLLRLGCMRDISEALRKSSFLLDKIPAVIEHMRIKGRDVDAVDIIYTLGMEDKLSQKIVAPFLKGLKEECKKARSEANGSLFPVKDANQKQLTALKSLMKCLENHKIDPAKVIRGWKLREKITNLEKDIAELDRKIASKRKAEEQSFRVSNDENFKRPKVIGETHMPTPSPFNSLQEPRTTGSLVYQLGSSYSDVVNNHCMISSWSNDYNPVGTSSRVTRSGANLGASISSGSSLAPPAVPSLGLHMPSSISSVDHGLVGSTDLGTHGYVGSSSLVQGFQGVTRTPYDAASWSSASDLYHFADAVLEHDCAARSTYRHGAVPAAKSHRSSIL